MEYPDALDALELKVDLEENGCYKTAKVEEDNEELVEVILLFFNPYQSIIH